MELLKERIRRDGMVKGTDVLKVDSFLNHQMDIKLFAEIGREFKRRFADCQIKRSSPSRLPASASPASRPNTSTAR